METCPPAFSEDTELFVVAAMCRRHRSITGLIKCRRSESVQCEIWRFADAYTMGYYSAHRTTPRRGGGVIPVVVVVVTVVVVVVDVRVVFASAICVACESIVSSIASKIKARAATPAETMGASAILPVVLVLFAASVPKWCRCHQLGCQKINKDKEGCGSVSGCPQRNRKNRQQRKSPQIHF